MSMSKTVLVDSSKFRLVSWGNGTAYTFDNKTAKRSVFLQGDDATQFRSELESMENAYPDRETDYLLTEMWEQYETVSVAEEPEHEQPEKRFRP